MTIETAWEEYLSGKGKSDNCKEEFEAGYRAALQIICKEVEPHEMVVGRYYWVGGMIGEMQGVEWITGADRVRRLCPIINGDPAHPMLFIFRGPIPNGSDMLELMGIKEWP